MTYLIYIFLFPIPEKIVTLRESVRPVFERYIGAAYKSGQAAVRTKGNTEIFKKEKERRI
jgi:hypothetical protein